MSFICEKCVNGDGEPGLHQFMVAKGQPCRVCDYCHKSSDSPTVELNQFIDYILECLEENGHISSKEEKKSIELSPFIKDMLYPATLENEKLCQDVDSLLNEKGIRYAFFNEKQQLINSWDDFSEYIKKESRFFFSSKSTILEEIMKIIKTNNLIRKIQPRRKKIYRARAFTEGNRIVNDLRRMGPPKPEDIVNISNRMSPPGVPIFYGSLDEATALFEISQKGQGSKGLAYIAEFYILKEITIIDLTLANRQLPSFFDINKTNRRQRNDLSFIKDLSFELSKPIDKDGREHTDYVPTQVLAEYIKTKNIHGIIYESSRKLDGKNIALFFSQQHFCIDDQKDPLAYLKFIKNEKTYNLPYNL